MAMHWSHDRDLRAIPRQPAASGANPSGGYDVRGESAAAAGRTSAVDAREQYLVAPVAELTQLRVVDAVIGDDGVEL